MVENLNLFLTITIVQKKGTLRSSLFNIISKVMAKIEFVWHLMVVLINYLMVNIFPKWTMLFHLSHLIIFYLIIATLLLLFKIPTSPRMYDRDVIDHKWSMMDSAPILAYDVDPIGHQCTSRIFPIKIL